MATLHTAAAAILVNGEPLDDAYMQQLLDVQVKDSLTLPDTAVVRLRDPTGGDIDRCPLKVGVSIEIKLGARGDNAVAKVFNGVIVALEPEFLEGSAIIAARAYDKSYKLNAKRVSRTFQQQSASDMVKKVIGQNGLAQGMIASTSVVFEFFQQSMETDWQFCWRLARMHNYEFVVEDDKAHFRPRRLRSAVASLKWGKSLLTFKPRLSGMGQAATVRVGNYDPKGKAAIVAEAAESAPTTTAPAGTNRQRLSADLGGGDVVLADRVTTTVSEANELATSALARMAGSALEADGKAVGNPKLRAGATVNISGVGTQFSGDYVLSGTTHVFRGGDQYTTTFVIAGAAGHTITELLNGQTGGNGTTAAWANTLVVGLVTNDNDPDQLGRVRVKYPGLSEDVESEWARCATINAGNDRGVYMLPQVNDEVVVGFEHGDPRRPIVLGGVFNGRDKPPREHRSDRNPRRSNFVVRADDKSLVESKQEMTLRSNEKMTVEVKRSGTNGTGDYLLDAAGKVTNKSASTMRNESQVFEVQAGQSVTVKGTSVTVEASAALTLKGATIDIQGSGPVNIKGAVINLG